MKISTIAIILSFFSCYNYGFADTLNKKEIKLGILKHSVKSGLKHAYEKGYDLNIEYLFSSSENKFFKALHFPYIHIGSNINSRGATSIIYTGFTWKNIFKEKYFLEISLGGCIHDGRLKQASTKKKALGSRLLFRESISMGFYLKEKQNISLFLDHASNAKLVSPNPGLTNFGIRYGFEL